METIKLEELTWPEIKEAIDNGYKTVVIAMGANEQHGPHLPTNTDTLLGDWIANKVALKIKKALQGPTINIGCSEHHMGFPGTISIKNQTLKIIVSDYIESLIKHGFKKIVFLPSHGGNFQPLEEIIAEKKSTYEEVKIIGYTDLLEYIHSLNTFSKDEGITPEESGAHAGESETSCMMAIAKSLVRERQFVEGYTSIFNSHEKKIVLEKGVKALSKNGIIGDPRKASSKKGEIYLKKVVDFLATEIKKKLSG